MRKLIQPYELRGGVLYHRRVRHGAITYQLCLPEPLVEQVLLACHDDVTAGHLGVTRTTYKIQQRYHWPRMKPQIVRFVLSCIDCQTKKRSREAPAGLLRPIQARRPFEKVGIDLIGPFPLTSSGNRHAIVAVDYLTKWAICKAVPAASAKEVVDFFVRNVVLQHGAPVFLISDRGKCLTASFAEELFRALQTNHLVTAAYHPQCNGLVERYNHTFAEMLSMYVNSYHNDWDGLIDFVTFAYNTSRQETTGVSPFLLLYGREAVLPIDVALGNNPEKGVGDGDPDESVRTLTAKLSQIREEVKERMAAIQAKQKKRYDRRRRQASFAEGELVLIYRPIRKKGRSTKLLHRHFGPYRIVRRVSDLNYVVEPMYGRKKKRDRVHVSSLKPFRLRAPSGSVRVMPSVAPDVSVETKEPKLKTPIVVRRREQLVTEQTKQKCGKNAPSSSNGLSGDQVGEHALRSRRDLKPPDRLDL